jgi:hypothetical protein
LKGEKNQADGFINASFLLLVQLLISDSRLRARDLLGYASLYKHFTGRRAMVQWPPLPELCSFIRREISVVIPV